MTTNRVPISRPPRTQRFTPAALEAFRKLRELHEDDPDARLYRSVLHSELKMKPWEYPTVVRPDPSWPSPPRDPRKAWGHIDAEKLWRELEEALQTK